MTFDKDIFELEAGKEPVIENVWTSKYLGDLFRADGSQFADITARIAAAVRQDCWQNAERLGIENNTAAAEDAHIALVCARNWSTAVRRGSWMTRHVRCSMEQIARWSRG